MLTLKVIEPIFETGCFHIDSSLLQEQFLQGEVVSDSSDFHMSNLQ